MKTNRLFTAICLLAGVLLAGSCSQNELTDGMVQDLPEGMYPLQIASVSLTAESSAEPWGADAPQTRVLENTTDGNSSVWTDGDLITVQIGNDNTSASTYSVDVDASGNVTGLTAETALYWKNTTAQKVKGWYPTDITNDIDLKNQSTNLAYALYAETAGTVDYQTTSIELPFTHQLAKIRVVLDGSEKENVTDVKVYTYPACQFTPNDATTKITGIGSPEYIPMKKTTYDNGVTYCWEANVVPGYNITKVKIGNVECLLNDSGVIPEVGRWHQIKINVEKEPIDFTNGDVTITSDGNYRIIGNNSNKKFIIQSGGSTINATITLENTTLESILLTEANILTTINATFIIKGTVTVSKGIVTQCGGRVIVKGTEGGKLTITNPDNYNPAIGNLNSNARNVELKIEDITIEATGAAGAAVIGTSSGWPGDGNVGMITIKNSTLNLTAVAVNSIKPAVIGTGGTDNGDLSCGDINIYLKEDQSKEQFLQKLKGNYNQQVGVGSASGGNVSCGSINWYKFDGSSAN